MIFTMKQLFVGIVLYVFSTCLASNENEVPCNIAIKGNCNIPAILNPVSTYGPPPIVSNFVHQGTNFFFNPQFLLGTNIPPPLGAVVAAIPNSPVVQIKEAVVTPELAPITSVEVIVEEPIEVIAPLPLPPPIPVTPEAPEVPIVLREMPPAPVLPPLVLPKIPVWVEESVEVAPACPENEIIITEVKTSPPAIIPPAPSLHPLVLPPKIIASEIEIETIPPAGPSMIGVPIITEKIVSSGFSNVKLTREESLHIIPTSPVVEIDVRTNEILKTNELTEIEKLLSRDEDNTVIMVPPAPEFPALEIPKPISEVLLIENDIRLPIPTDCARNIVMERVLPNIISKKTVTKSLEIISFPAVQYPVFAQL